MNLLRIIIVQNPVAAGVLLGFIFLVSAFAFLLPLIFSILIDRVLPQQAHNHFYLLIGLALFLVTLRFVLNAIQDYLFVLLRTSIERKVSIQFFTDVVFKLPVNNLSKIGGSHVASRLMLWLSNFQYFLSEFIYFCGYALAVSALVFGILVVIEPQFALLALVFLILHWINYQYHYPLVAHLSVHYNDAKIHVTQFLHSTFLARKAINLYQAEPAIQGEVNQSLFKLHCKLSGREQVVARQEYFQNGLRALQFTCFVYVGMHALSAQRITLGEWLFCLLLISLAYQPVYRLSKVTKLYAEAKSQFQQLMFLPDDVSDKVANEPFIHNESKELPQVSTISLEDIVLTKPNATRHGGNEDIKTVFNEVSHQFDRGKIYVVEGESGVGKSTLLRLISGVSHAEKGSVLWDSTPINQLSQSNKAKLLSWMTQHSGSHDFGFLAGTLGQNLTVFDESIFDHSTKAGDNSSAFANKDFLKLKQALALAHCDFLGISLEDDQIDYCHLQQILDTEIPAFAAPYSGGEAQRLNLARVLYQGGSIRLFDEPTANLDAQTETYILNAITATKQDCITIIVSHRHALRNIADEVLRLKGGKFIQVEVADKTNKGEQA